MSNELKIPHGFISKKDSIVDANFQALTGKFTTGASLGYIGVSDALGKLLWTDPTTLNNHTHTFASLTSKPATIAGYGITDAQLFITAGTTAQYWRGDKSWQTLPIYTLAGLGGQPLDADLTAIAGLAGISGFLKKTAADTWTLDTSTYLTSFTEADPIFVAWRDLSRTANTVYAGPTTGVATAPTFRTLVAADIPALSYAPTSGSANYIQNQNAYAQSANMWISGSGRFNNGLILSDDTNGSFIRMGRYSVAIPYAYISANLTAVSTGIRFETGTGGIVLTIENTGAATFASTIQATTAKLTNLTDGYIPYHISDASGLGDSNIFQSGANVGIGTTSPTYLLDLQKTRAAQLTLLRLGTTNASTGNGDEVSIDFSSSGDSFVNSRISRYIETFSTYASGLKFYTGATSINASPAMTIMNNGNVGIGTTAPGYKLSLSSAATTWATSPSIAFYDTAVTANARNWIIGNVAVNYGDLVFANSTAQGGDPGGNVRMVINKDGNVGIGTTNPSTKLEVGNYLDAFKNTLTIASRYEYEPELNFRLGQSGINYDWSGAKIVVGDDGNYNGKIEFRTANGGRDVPTVKMSIKANGNVGIGYSTGTEITNNKLAVNGSGFFSGSVAATSFNLITALSNVAPLINATTAVIGTSTLVSRQDHVHPTDTSRQIALNGTGFVKAVGTTISYDNSTYSLSNHTHDYSTVFLGINATAVNSNLLRSSIGWSTHPGDGNIGSAFAITNPTTGLFPATDNSNFVFNINRHSGEYNSQLGFSSNGNMYYRSFSAVAINTTQPWRTVWDSGNFTSGTAATNWTAGNDGRLSDARTATLTGNLLTAVPAGALFTDTIFTHPTTHPPSIITQDANNRFVTDTEKSTWNGKQNALNGTGFVKISGTTITYDNSTYVTGTPWTTANTSGNAATVTTNANLTGVVTSVGNATAIADAALSIAKTSGLQTALNDKVGNETDTYTATAKVTKMITLSQSEYNAIVTKDANTMYIII